MQIPEAGFVQGFIRMAEDGWQQGFHERNGGNLSYRIRPEELEEIKGEFSPGAWQEIGTAVPKLSGEFFLLTGSGKYFQNIIRKPEDCLGIIEVDEQGERYRIVWGLTGGGRPTSELPSHMMNHEVKLETTDGRHRVIYHAHPANLIALTFVLPLDNKIFTRELWEMISECPMYFPKGLGIVPWMVPGGREIAEATAKLMRRFDIAVWAHHGVFCSGEDFDQTFGLMHTLEKAAEILVKVLSMRGEKRQTVPVEGFKALDKALGLGLPEEFLYEKHVPGEDSLFAERRYRNRI